MNFGFRVEVGYDAEKDFTFLRSNTDDFSEQLVIPISRGTKEDLSLRNLLEDQGIVNFDWIHGAPSLPTNRAEMGFGVCVYDDAGDPAEHPHMVLFGKQGSGALNFIRLQMLWAAANNMSVVVVGSVDNMYGVRLGTEHLQLNTDLPLREQLDEVRHGDFKDIFLIFGETFDATTLSNRALLLEAQMGEIEGVTRTLVHCATLPETSDEPFTGSDATEGVTYAVIGDVNEVTAKKVGGDVPTRNRRGVMWLAHEDGETTRVKNYLVSRMDTM